MYAKELVVPIEVSAAMDIDHFYCTADHDTALCSLDISMVPEGIDGASENMCQVCDDLVIADECPLHGPRCSEW